MLAAALITLMCLGENNARNSPLLTSLVIDMDKQTVAGDGIGWHNDQPCPITEVTESYIRFKVSDAWSGEISRISGALTVTRSKEEEWQSIYDLICKPAYDRQDHHRHATSPPLASLRYRAAVNLSHCRMATAFLNGALF
jgi:hypothetical protein